jgi:ribulose-5-phosphate 4-epimerase/fuculose-1-phosphate aldolase
MIAETAQANQALGVSGQSDMVSGHASIRDPESRGVWMKASGSFDEVTDARVELVTPEGEVLAGNGQRHIEYPIHTEEMKARPDVSSVVHARHGRALRRAGSAAASPGRA